ncbi:MAG: type III-A CRISPR-associated protein Cas10/Csm1 [Spirochaetes bacterium]|nr:type III-A CRISPR-associated protein Cas10/Csm1 [Spirochaetota bacterium]
MDELLKQQYHIAFGALFHDIGKFKQRAYGSKPHSQFPQAMDGFILPSTEGGYGYKHALWTFDFFESDTKNFQLPKALDWNVIRDIAAKHHNPSTIEEEFIHKADIIASSQTRIRQDDHFTSNDYLKKHLRSIFPHIYTFNEPKKDKIFAYNLSILDTQNAFPVSFDKEDSLLQDTYKILWDSFLQDFRKVCLQWGKDSTLHHLLQSAAHILKKYSWCISAATNDIMGDSSLFDHAITTAAIALSLSLYSHANGNKMPSEDEKVFLLFAGDISGIQQFIFQRHHQVFKGSAKIIRGRSFFVSSIGLAYQYLLYKKLGMVPFTQLMSSSGKFYMLLPNTNYVHTAIQELKEQVDSWLFKEYHGDFAIVTDSSICASMSDLGNKEIFARFIGDINYNLSVEKYKKFNSILQRGECIIDVNYSEDEVCPSCGKYTKEKRYSDNEGGRCNFCNTMFELGAKIVRQPLYIVFNTKSGDADFFNKAISIQFANDVLPYQDAIALYTLDPHKVDTCAVWEFNNYVPTVNHEIKTFEEIAQSSIVKYKEDETDSRRGVPLLSFIKCDVDNLGFIFSYGIDDLSVERYVTLSRMLNYYFNTIVNSILHNKFPNVYTVFSGGDDLFLVAPFRDTIPLIKEIYTQFKLFTCNNPDIHFSTGVFVCHDNFPMSKAAELADEALEKTKSKDEKKDKIHYFDTMAYGEFFDIEDAVKWFEHKLLDESSTITQSFLYRLLRYTRMAQSTTFDKYLYLPHFKYDIARNIVKKDKGKIINADEVTWLEHFFEGKVVKKTAWVEAVLATAIYLLRKNKQENNKEVQKV